MRKEKPLPKEASFKEFSDNRTSRTNNSSSGGNRKPVVNPKFKKMFNDKDSKPDRRSSRGPNGMAQSKSGHNSFKEDGRNSGIGNREMFDAICGKCKKPCKVPFKPTTGKPVSCSDCFVRKDVPSRGREGSFQSRGRDNFSSRGRADRSSIFQSRGREGNFQSRDNGQRFARTNSGTKELFDAVCSKCKNKCKVPFKPTTGKPVSCSNCFVKKESPGRGRSSFGGGRDSGRRDGFSRGRSDSRDSGRGQSRDSPRGRSFSRDSSRGRR